MQALEPHIYGTETEMKVNAKQYSTLFSEDVMDYCTKFQAVTQLIGVLQAINKKIVELNERRREIRRTHWDQLIGRNGKPPWIEEREAMLFLQAPNSDESGAKTTQVWKDAWVKTQMLDDKSVTQAWDEAHVFQAELELIADEISHLLREFEIINTRIRQLEGLDDESE